MLKKTTLIDCLGTFYEIAMNYIKAMRYAKSQHFGSKRIKNIKKVSCGMCVNLFYFIP